MSKRRRGERDALRSLSFTVFCLLIVVLPGCGAKTDADDRFSAQTYDEYTQPLTSAIIGTPDGVVTTIGNVSVLAPAKDAGVGGSGAVGGSSSGGSSSGVTGSSGGSGSSSGSSSGGPGFDGGFQGDGGFDDEGGTGQSGGFGQWHFDDCSPSSHFLSDSSGMGANAQQALGAACVPGISNLGVQIRNAKDVVQVPDEPQFTVGQRVAVAAWVHPDTVSGNQPIVIKRLNNQTSFSLGIHNGNIEMSVVLTTGTTVISRAPISAGVWTHVAGMFDGTFVFLFINGQQFGQVFGAGTIQDVFAPIRIGATTQSQHFDGIIDEVFVSTEAIPASTLQALACISRPSTISVSPATSGPVPFDTTVHYDVTATDNDVGFCGTKDYDLFFESFDPNINITLDAPNFGFTQLTPGTSADFGVDVTGSDEADPGEHDLPFILEDFLVNGFSNFEELQGQLVYDLAQPTGCFVFTRRELMITNTSVVDDPVRTFGVNNGQSFDGGILFGGDAGVVSLPPGVGVTAPIPDEAGPPPTGPDGGASASTGVWSFGHLMREMAPTPDQGPALALQLFQHWLTDQTVNDFTVSARPAMKPTVIDAWPKTPDGQLDLDQAPLRLQAIVNRIDLRNLAKGSAGEGRFVFAVQSPGNTFPLQFTVIVEYNLPAQTQQDVTDWANRWHALSSLPFPSEEYNAALEAITRRFSDRNASPGSPNGSALIELRTNEIALSDIGRWELRAFVLSPTTGMFDETTVKETPDLSFNGTSTLADFVNANADAIKAVIPGAAPGTVPPQFEDRDFLAGSIFNDLVVWNAPGIVDPEARFHQSLNTCNGCHGPETNTDFLMVNPRSPGSEASLSPFLTGTTVTDVNGITRSLNDLGRRNADLTSLVCTGDGGAASADAGAPPVADGGAVSADAGPKR